MFNEDMCFCKFKCWHFSSQTKNRWHGVDCVRFRNLMWALDPAGAHLSKTDIVFFSCLELVDIICSVFPRKRESFDKWGEFTLQNHRLAHVGLAAIDGETIWIGRCHWLSQCCKTDGSHVVWWTYIALFAWFEKSLTSKKEWLNQKSVPNDYICGPFFDALILRAPLPSRQSSEFHVTPCR